MKRGTVDGMYHTRDSERPSRRAAQDPRLGTVGVHHLGPQLSDRLFEDCVSFSVGPGAYRANELRDLDDPQIRIVVLLEQGAFGTQTRSCNECDVVPEIASEVQAIESCVLLGTADDHSGNDMDDSHTRRIAKAHSVFCQLAKSGICQPDPTHSELGRMR